LSIILKLNILHQEKKKDEKHFTSFLKSAESQEVEIVFLDPGMVTILNKNDRAAFLKLVMYVTLRKPDECGQLML
jgi:aarF domain-containing kinase